MSKIWVTSDTHFCHDREFIWKVRGFNSVQEMNEEIVRRWNEVVSKEDIVWHLGDVMLNNTDEGMKYFSQLNGTIHLICGNHDTAKRIEAYKTLPNVIFEGYAATLKYKKLNFYLSHYPTITAQLEATSLHECVCNLYGHTHQKTKFYNGIFFMYHCGMDSNNCTPRLLDDIISEMKDEVVKSKEQL